MKDKILFITMLLTILVINAHAQEILTLNDAVNIALKNNNYVQMAKNIEKISKNNFHIGNAGILPSIDFTGNSIYNDQETKLNGVTTSTKSTSNSANISASYTIFDGLSKIYNYNKLEASAESGTLEKRQQTENTISAVISAYFNVARSADQLQTADEALVISNERLLRTEKKMEFGQAGKIDYLNSRVDFHADSVNYINAKTYLQQAKQNLNIMLNRDVNTDFIVSSDIGFDSLPTISELTNLAEEKNAENLLAEKEIEIAEQDVNLSFSNFLPKLSVRASYGYNGLYNDFDITLDDPNKSFTTTLTLSYNLFNGFKNSIQKQNAEVLLDNSKLLSEQTKKEINNEVISSYQLYRDSRTILNMEEANLEAAEANFERTKELYDLGKITNTEFRQAQLKLIQAKNSISSAKYNAKTYETELKRLCGILLEEESL